MEHTARPASAASAMLDSQPFGTTRPRSPTVVSPPAPVSKRRRGILSADMPAMQHHHSDFQDQNELIRTTDYVRLLHSALTELGCDQAAEALQTQSGTACQSTQVSRLCEQVLQRDWRGACKSAAACSDLSTEQQQKAQFCLLQELMLEVRSCAQKACTCNLHET